MKKIQMKALTSIPARAGRKSIARGETFDAVSETDAKTFERMGQAERVAADPAAKPAATGSK